MLRMDAAITRMDARVDARVDAPMDSNAALADSGLSDGMRPTPDAPADALLADALLPVDARLPDGPLPDALADSSTPTIAIAWLQSFAATKGASIESVAIDHQDNIYVAGYRTGGTTYNVTTAILASYAPDGVLRWEKSFGTPGNYIRARSLVVDSKGNVFVTGNFSGTVYFNSEVLTSAGAYDIFLASYESDGVQRWCKSFGDVGLDFAHGIAVDASDNVFVTGSFEGKIRFGGSNPVTAEQSDIFLVSLTTLGTHRWSQGFGGPLLDVGYAIAIDQTGGVYVTGSFSQTVDFGGSTLGTLGEADVFLAKFTTGGVHSWSTSFGSPAADNGYGLATDKRGDIYVGGTFEGTLSFGGSPPLTYANSGGQDGLLAAFTSDGQHRWSKTFGSSSDDGVNALSVNAAGDVYAVGYFS
ncbi:MAG: SBBP repeat-containing protein [Deltaproteobacteria bacterium]|nr:SBBP repeat-containing protein [Deltaproteobacteria bacterium]